MLSFRDRVKRVFEIELHDGTKLRIPPPSKGLLRKLIALGKSLEEHVSLDTVDDLISTVLGSNIDKTTITDKQLQLFDFEDSAELLTEYTDFANQVKSSPN